MNLPVRLTLLPARVEYLKGEPLPTFRGNSLPLVVSSSRERAVTPSSESSTGESLPRRFLNFSEFSEFSDFPEPYAIGVVSYRAVISSHPVPRWEQGLGAYQKTGQLPSENQPMTFPSVDIYV